MKLTLTTFAAALALYLAAVGLATRPQKVESVVALDMAGIRAVTLKSPGNATLLLGSQSPSTLRFTPSEGQSVDVQRQGDTLVINSTLAGYNRLDVRLPATLGLLDLDNVTATSEVPLEQMHLRASGRVSWSGDVGHLDLVAGAKKAECGREPECRRRITVKEGRIGRLTATVVEGVVSLEEPDTIGEAELRLGAKAQFSLSNATRLDQLRIVPLDATD